MAFLIAAAGTGGHVYPGLAVGEALLHHGVSQDQISYVGGDRLEAEVYPAHGFGFIGFELMGFQRRPSMDNARIPAVVMRARREMAAAMGELGVRAALGMGGYVTVPTALAARSRRIPFFNAEQNASAGLANRVSARWARASFVSFPNTVGLPKGKWVGNPVRRPFWSFDRGVLRTEALTRYRLDPKTPTLGVFGGSLGAGIINDAVATMLETWSGDTIQVVHLTGRDHLEALRARSAPGSVSWSRHGFEERMELFLAACDLVVARAGGAVAELTATGTPSVLVPGRFGSGGHQEENARFLETSGAAVVVDESELYALSRTIRAILWDHHLLESMGASASAIAKPQAALSIADAMIEAAR